MWWVNIEVAQLQLQMVVFLTKNQPSWCDFIFWSCANAVLHFCCCGWANFTQMEQLGCNAQALLVSKVTLAHVNCQTISSLHASFKGRCEKVIVPLLANAMVISFLFPWQNNVLSHSSNCWQVSTMTVTEPKAKHLACECPCWLICSKNVI